MNWVDFPNFGPDEFRCSCCNVVEMDPAFIATLQRIRDEFGPMAISSGYRRPKHPVEARKSTSTPGAHARGLAADILVSGSRAMNLLRIALSYDEVQGVGINQKGKGRFIHLDGVIDDLPRPHLWSY